MRVKSTAITNEQSLFPSFTSQYLDFPLSALSLCHSEEAKVAVEETVTEESRYSFTPHYV